MQCLLTADLTQGVCHERERYSLMPVPGAPSYALSNLEHTVIAGLTPAWFKDVQEAFYYGGLTGGWLVILVTILACVAVHPAAPSAGRGSGSCHQRLHHRNPADPEVLRALLPGRDQDPVYYSSISD